MNSIFPELATATQPFGTLNDHDHDRRSKSRTEAITRRERRAPQGSSLGNFFRFVQ